MEKFRYIGGHFHINWRWMYVQVHDIQGIKYIACYVKRLKLFGFLDKQEALARGGFKWYYYAKVCRCQKWVCRIIRHTIDTTSSSLMSCFICIAFRWGFSLSEDGTVHIFWKFTKKCNNFENFFSQGVVPKGPVEWQKAVDLSPIT